MNYGRYIIGHFKTDFGAVQEFDDEGQVLRDSLQETLYTDLDKHFGMLLEDLLDISRD